ncbi:hypothetical protein [Trujillonella humicola]|uniref:hypothetical protein n=1 Tax=Trujillonella humicola TaxID=3383699 RepID=UPI0039068BB0
MIVEVVGGADQRPEVRVVDVDDLTSVFVAVGEVTDEEVGAALAAAGLGRLEDADTAALDAAAVRAAAEPNAGGGDWGQRWERLTGSATEAGTLRVPVRSAAGA